MQKISSEERSIFIQQGAQTIDDEADLIDLAKIIGVMQRNWTTLLGSILVAMACAAAIFATLPSKWRASAVLQIGQMPVSPTFREIAPIEPLAQAVEKLKLHQKKIVAAAGFSPEQANDTRAALLRNTLKASVVKNTNLIDVSVSGFSAQEAQNNLTAAVRVLIETHDQLLAPVAKRMRDQLQDSARQIAQAETARAKLQALLADAAKLKSDAQFGPTIVAINLLENKETELRRLAAERSAVEDMLAPAKTFPTTVLDAVHADSAPYFPKLGLFLMLGGFIGTLLGLAAAFYRDRKRKVGLGATTSPL